MKQIHVLPTDKPSRIRIGNNGNFVFGLMQNSITSKNDSYTNQNIYITSDEEIKEGDWFMSDFNSFPIHNIKELSEREGTLGWEKKDLKNNLKIILTTDQDLIKDGVQAIGDEFLELFVKNPSCDSVEVETVKFCLEKASISLYQIITPKQIGFKVENGKRTETFYREPKQETLEEVAEKFAKKFGSEIDSTRYYAFINGAKWQQEQDKNKFSEAIDIFEYILEYDDGVGIALGYNSRVMIERFIKQFKNK